jgi:signal transduction histidine kinase
LLKLAFSTHNNLTREEYLTLHLDAVRLNPYMIHSQKFASLVPKEIQQSRLFVAAVLDSKGNVLYFTESLLEMFKVQAPERPLHYTDIIIQDDLERLRDALTLCLIGKTVSSLQLQMQAREGRPAQNTLWELTPASHPDLAIDEALALCIGTRLPSGTVLTALRAEGEDEVINNLLRRNRDLEQFANIVAHNIRSPLANIMGLNKLLNLELSEDDKITALRGINTSAEKLENVIRDLNDVLQIRKAAAGSRDEINLEKIVQDVEHSISGMIAEKGAVIMYEFGEAPVIHSVRSYIQSIFQNLLTNALKYSRDGEVPMVKISSYTEGKYTVIRVTDNGIGIDLQKHGANMFGLYKRFTDQAEGKGLGLYMVKTQVEALEGFIDIESELGKGTEFIIRLPNKFNLLNE